MIRISSDMVNEIGRTPPFEFLRRPLRAIIGDQCTNDSLSGKDLPQLGYGRCTSRSLHFYHFQPLAVSINDQQPHVAFVRSCEISVHSRPRFCWNVPRIQRYFRFLAPPGLTGAACGHVGLDVIIHVGPPHVEPCQVPHCTHTRVAFVKHLKHCWL